MEPKNDPWSKYFQDKVVWREEKQREMSNPNPVQFQSGPHYLRLKLAAFSL